MSKPPEKKAPPKSYHMMYVQQMKHLPAGNVDNLIKLVETRLNPKEYGIIVHDKDPGEEAHVQCMLSFKNARSLNNVAKLLGDKSQYIEKWEGNPNNGFAYLIHATEKARKGGKYQYDPSEVRANFDYPARLMQMRAEMEDARAEHTGKVNSLLSLM